MWHLENNKSAEYNSLFYVSTYKRSVIRLLKSGMQGKIETLSLFLN